MMTGMEIPAVIGVVSALIGAYNNAQAIIERYKDKRKKYTGQSSHHIAETEQLESSVKSARSEILREATKGEDTIGEAFAEGDNEAVLKLQGILIQLNDVLIARLLAIQRGEASRTELQELRVVADVVRDDAVMELMSLRQRLDKERRAHLLNNRDASPSVPLARHPRQDSKQTNPAVAQMQGGERDKSATKNIPLPEAETSSTKPDPGPSRPYPVPGYKNSADSRTASGKKRADPPPKLRGNVAPVSEPHSAPLMRGARRPTSITSTLSDESSTSIPIRFHENRRATAPELPEINRLSIASFRDLEQSSPDGSHSPPSNLYADMDPISVPRPTAQNKYLGLCKGAVKLWNGEKDAFHFGLDYIYWTSQASTQAAFCSKSLCTFKHACDPDKIWGRVIVDEARGLKYRWSFLAKSHVENNKPAQNGQFLYQCLFCTFLKYPKTPMTQDKYLTHVDREHRGSGSLHPVILYNTGCVSDHECSNHDDFDINLLPLTPEEKAARRPLNFRASVIGTADDFAAFFPTVI